MFRLLLVSCLLIVATSLHAETRVSDGWIKQLPPSVPMRAGYLTIANTGETNDKLLSASSPAFKMIEMHESRMSDGMMTMNEMPEIPVPAGATVEFKPGGLHLMLMGLQQYLEIGDQVPVTLTFESGAQTLQLEVKR